MKTIFKLLAIFFGLGSLGLLTKGQINPMILFLAILFGYLGWRTKSEGDQVDSKEPDANNRDSDDATGPIDYPNDYDITDEYHFYDTYFRDQMELWKIQHGTIKYEEIKRRVLTSEKLKARLKQCSIEGGTYVGPKDVAALINGITFFTFSKKNEQALAAQIFVHAWHYNVNRNHNTFNPHQVTKYLNDVTSALEV